MAVHPASALLRYFEYNHLPEGPLRDVSRECADLAEKLTAYLPLNAEQTTGLRKLLEAKDCFVRAALDKTDGPREIPSFDQVSVDRAMGRAPMAGGEWVEASA